MGTFLLAVLNYPVSEALIRTNTSPFRGGYYSHDKQFIKNLPVPIAAEAQRTEIEERVATLIAALDELAAARTPRERTRKGHKAAALRSEIENRMSAVFVLSEVAMETVRAAPVPA